MMTTETPPHLLPKLRFAEFVDEPPWENRLLKNLAKRITQRNTHGAELRALTNSAERGIVDQREYFDKVIATNTNNYYIVETGDYVYNPRISSAAPVGPISKNQIGTGVMSPLYMVFRFRSDANDFFAHYFRSSHWHRYLRRVSNSGARHDRMAITNDDLMRMPIPTPSPREQQKIADCLGSLDDLIAVEGRRLEALRQHKQGLMQQLFPQEGETQPHLRFPEFKDAPEWEEWELRSVCDRIMDGTHFSPKSKSGPRPYLTSKNIRNAWMDLSTASYISEEEHREIFARCPVQQFDVLLTKDGANTGTCAINLLDYEFSLLSSVAVLRGDVSRLTQGFLFQSFVSERMQSTIRESMSGQAITRITLEKLGSYEIALPSIPEQHRIAECLSFLDACIAAQTRRGNFLGQHKKALLQQLFPSLDGNE